MRYLLDTNILIALLNPRLRGAVLERLTLLREDDVTTSVIVAHELYYGAAKSARPAENRRRFDAVLADFGPLGLSEEDARRAGEVRAVLRKKGTPIGPYDTLIAGQALARGLAVATANTGEFERVEGLIVDDWLTP